jgi:hypothetical protein
VLLLDMCCGAGGEVTFTAVLSNTGNVKLTNIVVRFTVNSNIVTCFSAFPSTLAAGAPAVPDTCTVPAAATNTPLQLVGTVNVNADGIAQGTVTSDPATSYLLAMAVEIAAPPKYYAAGKAPGAWLVHIGTASVCLAMTNVCQSVGMCKRQAWQLPFKNHRVQQTEALLIPHGINGLTAL